MKKRQPEMCEAPTVGAVRASEDKTIPAKESFTMNRKSNTSDKQGRKGLVVFDAVPALGTLVQPLVRDEAANQQSFVTDGDSVTLTANEAANLHVLFQYMDQMRECWNKLSPDLRKAGWPEVGKYHSYFHDSSLFTERKVRQKAEQAFRQREGQQEEKSRADSNVIDAEIIGAPKRETLKFLQLAVRVEWLPGKFANFPVLVSDGEVSEMAQLAEQVKANARVVDAFPMYWQSL
jgi:hypothetical protein